MIKGEVIELLNSWYKNDVHTERVAEEIMALSDISNLTIKRICEHKDCNKEFTLKINITADKRKGNVSMQDCPHCGKRNDIWIELS